MKYTTGAKQSPLDVRTFSYKPDKANYKGGAKYTPSFIEDQHKVGICTAISLTMNAHKATGKRYSADFQYLIQKRFLDGNWDEGSSIMHAIKAGHKYGLLPEKHWKFTDENDRKLSYSRYVKKLQKITLGEIDELLKKTEKPISAYAKVPVTRDYMANAIDETNSGILVRFEVGEEWWTAPIEPLRRPKQSISGHAVTNSNYTGNSFRVANSWGTDWSDQGTAYWLQHNNSPTEAWIVYYDEPSEPIKEQIEQKELTKGQLLELLQKLIEALNIKQ